MKKYPNNTMMGELQDRLQKLQRSPSNFTPAIQRKIEDLEKILLIADLQRKLQHQRSVSASLPSSSTMKSLVRKTKPSSPLLCSSRLQWNMSPTPARRKLPSRTVFAMWDERKHFVNSLRPDCSRWDPRRSSFSHGLKCGICRPRWSGCSPR